MVIIAEENIQYAPVDTSRGRPSGVAPIFTSVEKKEKHNMHCALITSVVHTPENKRNFD